MTGESFYKLVKNGDNKLYINCYWVTHFEIIPYPKETV